MVLRTLFKQIGKSLSYFKAVALLGPRQCGKSTLAREYISKSSDWIYLDLERPSDISKLNDPEAFFNSLENKRICIDEVQLRPDLFAPLRSILDQYNEPGKVLLLGSASPELLRQGSETLAGRIAFLELTPFTYPEIKETVSYREHWARGGFPLSTLAPDDSLSVQWRENFLRTFVERDLSTFGFKLQSQEVLRFLTMCAHSHGQLFNVSKIGESLGVSRQTLTKWSNILEQCFIIRKLTPHETNVKKRIIKSFKIYLRDSGLCHTLLNISSFQDLLGNPILGNSWEGYAIENIATTFSSWSLSFYRTSHGAEIDLIMEKGEKKVAVEFKNSLAPKVSKGFWSALDDIKPQKTFVIIPEGERYPLKNGVEVISLKEFLSIPELELSNPEPSD